MKHDLVGSVYGRLTVLHHNGRTPAGKVRWMCSCSCGVEHITIGSDLVAGKTLSCGCLGRERRVAATRTHGFSRTGTYQSWKDMMARCYRPRVRSYLTYGGRGVQVCDEWHAFEAFHKSMGDRPVGLEIDRLDVNGDYHPLNCRWATQKEQAMNRRVARRFVDINDCPMSLRDLSAYLAINSGTLWGRLINAGVILRREKSV